MKTIVMDTSNAYLVVALFEDDHCVAKIQEQGNKRQSEYALTYLERLLKQQQWALLDVDTMIVTIGPGSYTGQRVALTIAKTLAAISKIQIKVVSSLHAYAGASQAISVIDARSQKIFVGVYKNNQPVIPDQMILLDDFSKLQEQYPEYPIVGDGVLVGANCQEVDLATNIFIAAKNVPTIEDVDNLVPQYLKDVEAKKICK